VLPTTSGCCSQPIVGATPREMQWRVRRGTTSST
jgi:hypothetical protein